MKKVIAIIILLTITYTMGFSDGQESAYIKMANKKTDYMIKKHYKGE